MFTSIRSKLLSAFILLTLLSLITGYFNYVSIKNNNDAFTHIIEEDTPRIQALLEMKSIANEIELNAFTIQIQTNTSATSQAVLTSDQKYELLASLELLNRWSNEYKERINPIHEKNAEVFWKIIEQTKSAIISAALEYIHARETNQTNEVILQKGNELNQQIAALESTTAQALTFELNELNMQKDLAEERVQYNLSLTLVMSVITALIAVIFWFFLNKILVRPLQALKESAVAVSNGDFNHTITTTSYDEIGVLARAWNEMTRRLRKSHEDLAKEADLVKKQSSSLDAKVVELERLNKFMTDRELKMIELKQKIKSLQEHS